MNCENALELMNRELDEALTAEESAALQAHLDACPDCRGTWRQLHELDAAAAESELEPPAALHDGVMRAIRQEQRKPAPRMDSRCGHCGGRSARAAGGQGGADCAAGLRADRRDLGQYRLGGRADLCADRCGSTGRSRRTARRRSFPPRQGWTCCWCGTAAFRLNWKQRRMKRRRAAPGCIA
ncbi:MAG: anti-sigma factor family protein [Acutalibacteraceae bacterium]